MISIESANHVRADDLLSALGDPTRRRIVELLALSPRTASEIHAAFPIANPAVSRHLRVLREAGLIVERPVAEDRRVRLYALEPRALENLSAWIAELSAGWQAQLESFKDYVEVRSGRRAKTR
jgi:DNA-binding transcriptional ArsR family regulator